MVLLLLVGRPKLALSCSPPGKRGLPRPGGLARVEGKERRATILHGVADVPDDLSVLWARAMTARRRRRIPESRALLTRLLEASRDPSFALLARAHVALLDGDRESAEKALAQVAETLPSDTRTAALGMLVAERWPAESRDCETHLVATARAYRKLCRSAPQPGEIALELGAAQGLATRMIARRSALVYAVEKSAAMAERTRETTAGLANVRVIVADVEDLGLVRAHAPRADLIFLDIGGSTPVAKVLDVARWYQELYRPRALMLRSVHLNHFVAGLASVEPTRGPSSLTP
ncbi:MAG: hypothetical protein FJX75_21055 [Armatimonadetes bacterium]|nr:hypothetical protein [Armatimonadota bacterium]